ncbi:MAG: flippase [Solirubrobacterales bacterium]
MGQPPESTTPGGEPPDPEQPPELDRSRTATARRIGRNVSLRALGDIISKVATLVLFVAIARELGEDSLGDVVFALSLAALVIVPAALGTEELMGREVARDFSQVHRYLPNLVALRTVMTVPLLAGSVGVLAALGYTGDELLVVVLVSLAVAFESLAIPWQSAFQAFERLGLVSASVVAQRVVSTTIGVAVLAKGGDVLAVAVAFPVGSFVGWALAVYLMRSRIVRIRWQLDPSGWGSLIRRGIPNGIADLAFTVLLRVDSVLLGLLRGGADSNRQVGLYGAAFRLIESTMFISWSLSGALFPWFSRSSDSHARGYQLALKASMTLLMPLAAGLAVLAGPVVELLYGDRFAGAVLPMRILAGLIVLYGVNQLAVAVLVARGQPLRFARLAGGAAALNIALNLALIPPLGAVGAAIAATASGVALAAAGLLAVQGVLGRVNMLPVALGPALGALAMVAVGLVLPAALWPTAPVIAILYPLVLVAIERLVFPDDLAMITGVLRRRGGDDS